MKHRSRASGAHRRPSSRSVDRPSGRSAARHRAVPTPAPIPSPRSPGGPATRACTATLAAVFLVALPLPTGPSEPGSRGTVATTTPPASSPSVGTGPQARTSEPGAGDREVPTIPTSCAVDMSAHDLASASALGAAAAGASVTLCSPLGAAGALPRTDLEEQEPERLYALVTRDRAVAPLDYAPQDLAPVDGGPYRARAEVVDQLEALRAAAREAGLAPIVVTSGFRDHQTQAGTYQDWVRRAGSARADAVSAQPGHSEHQLGLAVDISGPCGGFACFAGTPEAEWVAANAHRFGFIVRYPEGGEEVTGYAYEPWHLRYVGPRAAWAMHLQGERYWERFAQTALDAAG